MMIMEQVSLGEICKEIYRYPTYYGIEYLDTGVPEVRGELIIEDGTIDLNRQKWRFISETTSSKFPRTNLEEGDLIMSVRGTIGKVGIVPHELHGANITANLIRISPNKQRVYERYLWMYMRSPEFLNSLNNESSLTTIKTIKAPNLKALLIPLPSLPDQRKIADILDRAEALRTKRRSALAQLDELVQSIFVEMFGDPATNPKGWKIKFLRELVSEFRYGTSNKSQAEGKATLRIPNVIGGIIDYSDLKFVPVDASEFERLKLIDGDVLFVRTNGNPDFVGRCAVFDSDTAVKAGYAGGEFIFASYLIRARIQTDQVTPIFLREFMLGNGGRRELRSRCKTSAGQFNINTENLGAIAIPLPPLSLQKEFARRIEAINRLKKAYEASLAELDELFASLQYRAFRGELGVIPKTSEQSFEGVKI